MRPLTQPPNRATAGPLPPRAVRVVGEVRENQARRAGELAEMDRRLAADPNDAEALIHRGWLRLNLSKPAKAVADLERGVRLRPDDTDALFLLSQAYSQTNNLQAARAALETYLTRCPDDTDARIKKGQIGDSGSAGFPEAADEFTRVLEAEPRPGSSPRPPRGDLAPPETIRGGPGRPRYVDRALPERSGSPRTSQSGP